MNVADQSLNLARRTQSPGEELANSISHAIGLVGAIIGTPVLLLAALRHASAFYRVDVARVFWVDAVSRLAADACEILSPSDGPLGDFFANRGNVYAICPRS